MDQSTVTLVNQLTLAGAAIFACGILWRAYSNAVSEHIKDLREQNTAQIADLRARLMVIEDALHINANDRVKYLPKLGVQGKSEMKDLD